MYITWIFAFEKVDFVQFTFFSLNCNSHFFLCTFELCGAHAESINFLQDFQMDGNPQEIMQNEISANRIHSTAMQ